MPSQKILEAKKKAVSDLAQSLREAQCIVLVDYRGITVEEDTQMRSALREENVTYRVIKNSILSRAFSEMGIEGLEDVMQGPTAVAFSKEDMISPARIIKSASTKVSSVEIKGGLLEGKVISLDEIDQLASIPSKEVLYGQLVFGILSPITSLALVLNAIKEKREETSGEKEPAELKAEKSE
jgi:large subunit ribosomal protein L10